MGIALDLRLAFKETGSPFGRIALAIQSETTRLQTRVLQRKPAHIIKSQTTALRTQILTRVSPPRRGEI